MASCHHIKKGDIYTCKTCGLSLKVIETCKRFGTPPEECDNCGGQYQFSVTCCGDSLKSKNGKKKSRSK